MKHLWAILLVIPLFAQITEKEIIVFNSGSKLNGELISINLNQKMIINGSKIGTLASNIKNKNDLKNENIVKVITKKNLEVDQFSEAKTFVRNSSNLNNIYHHIGIYCYRTEILEQFVKLSQSKNEIKNRLEQLRALDNNININVAHANSSPIGVDTEEDYIALKKIMEYKDQ